MKKISFWGNPFKKYDPAIDSEIDFISSVHIFDSLTKRQEIKIYSIIHVRHYEKEEVVFRQGDPGVGMFVVRDGELEVYNEYRDMTCRKIYTLKKGDFFGEMSLLNESPRSATIISIDRSTLWGLYKPALMNLLESDPNLGVKIILNISQVLAERLRLINEKMYGMVNGH